MERHHVGGATRAVGAGAPQLKSRGPNHPAELCARITHAADHDQRALRKTLILRIRRT